MALDILTKSSHECWHKGPQLTHVFLESDGVLVIEIKREEDE